MRIKRKVRYSKTNKSHIMAIPRPILTHLDLVKGNFIEYIINEDNTVTIRKIEEINNIKGVNK